MPNHLVISGCVEASLKFQFNTRSPRVVIHYIIPDGSQVNSALADAIFAGIGGNWTTNLAAQCSTSVTFQGIDLRDLRQQGMPLVSSTTAARLGTAVGDNLPASLAACLTVRTNRAGRSFRGRMYMPGFCETANSPAGGIIAATKTALDAFCTNFVSSANVSGLQFGVAHRPTAYDPITGLPISPGLGFVTPAVNVVCRDSTWDSQRRRVQ